MAYNGIAKPENNANNALQFESLPHRDIFTMVSDSNVDYSTHAEDKKE